MDKRKELLEKVVEMYGEYARKILNEVISGKCDENIFCKGCVMYAFEYAYIYYVMTGNIRRAAETLIRDLEECLRKYG